jgi:hypothetical protein
MPKAYSLDLRERVVGFVEDGHSRRAAAAHFKVSVSFVVNLMKAIRTRGSLEAKPSGGRRHAKLEPHRSFLLAQVAEKATSPCRSWRPSASPRPARRPIPLPCRAGSFAPAIVSKTYGPPRLQGGLSRLAADPVCINVSGLEELRRAMMEIGTLRSS